MNGASVNYEFNTKLFRMQSQHASAELSLASANNVEAVRIDTSQRVGIGTSSPSQKLHVTSSGTSALIEGRGNGNNPILHVKDTADTMVALFEGNRAGDTGAAIHIYHNPATSQENNRTRLNFEMNDSGDTKTVYAQLASFIDDHTNGTEDGHLKINTMTAGSLTEHLHIGNQKISGSATSTGSFGKVSMGGTGFGLAFHDDPDTGIRYGGTNTLEIHTNGSKAMEFNGSQVAFFSKTIEVLGQNLTHGASRIKISQESTALSEFRFYGADTSTAGSLRFLGSSSDGSVGGTRMTIASSGDVEFPLANQKISGSAASTGSFGHMILNCGSPKKVLQIGRAGYKYIYANNANDDDIPTFQTYNDGTNYYGLGQEVFGTYLVSDDNSNDERAHIAFYINSRPNDNGTAGSPKMIISGSSGKVGIGTTSPDSQLSISATSNTTFEALQLENVHGEGSSQGTVDIVGDVIASNGLTARGRIQFREATSDANVSVIAFFTSNNTSLEPTERMTIAQDGVISGDFNDTSDINLKENISEISSSYEKVKQLNPVTFNWKEEEEKGTDEQIGFIAQEVEKVYPQLVEGEEGNKSVNVVGLVSVLTKTVQELSEKVEAQQKEIEELKNK